MRVELVIPAYNEALRIGEVLASAMMSRVDRVVVVDDGSTDNTAQIAAERGADVIRLARNTGKARAMLEGLHATCAPVVVFIDADLTGLHPWHIEDLIAPVIIGQAEMTVGQLPSLPAWMLAFSGQRAMRRWVMEAAADQPGFVRYGAETVLNQVTTAVPRQIVLLNGVGHHAKTAKWGLVNGLATSVSSVGNVLGASGASKLLLAVAGLAAATAATRRV